MANELAIAMRDAGTELAETFANRDSSGSRTRYGTVTANNGATLDVELAGGSVSGVPMTTACVGARAGDRVLLTVDGPLITATGILATADNGPYVMGRGVHYRNVVINTDANSRWYWCTESQFQNTFGVKPQDALVLISNGDAAAASFVAAPSYSYGNVYVDTTRANARIRIYIHVVTFW